MLNTKTLHNKASEKEQLRLSGEYLQSIVKSMSNSLIITDADGQIETVNKVTCRLTGYKEEELIAKSIKVILSEKMKQDDLIKKGFSDRVESVYLSKDGKKIPVLFSVSAIYDNKKNIQKIIYIASDITKRKQAAKKITESEERYRSLFEDSPISLWEEDFSEVKKYIDKLRNSGTKDFKSYFDKNPKAVVECVRLVKITDINKATLQLYEANNKKELLFNLSKFFVEESFEMFKEELIALASGKAVFECENITKTLKGEKKYVSLKLFVAPDAEETWSKVLLSIIDITQRRQAEQELRKYHEHLEELVEERTSELKMINEQLQDEINERKRTEVKLRDTMKELARSNTELEQFAYAVSHDLQEPLQVVMIYLKQLAKEYKGKPLDAEGGEYISNSLDSINHMSRLINDLLLYSRVGMGNKPLKTVDCEVVFNKAVNNLKKLIQDKGAVIAHDKLPAVAGDELQLIQLFQNLIGNGIKFHGTDQPRVHVSAKQKEDEWIFSVCDNGIGIDPKYFNQIFGVFKRLDAGSEYPGTGIGLAICKKIVENRGGRIWVKSEPCKGAAFYFTIPERRIRES